MKLNEEKSKYMIFTRSLTEIATRLEVNSKVIDRIEETKLLGIWLTTYLDWSKNTKEICRKSYTRLSLLTKLKYVWVIEDDLLEIYILYIRSLLEYCWTVWQWQHWESSEALIQNHNWFKLYWLPSSTWILWDGESGSKKRTKMPSIWSQMSFTSKALSVVPNQSSKRKQYENKT